MKRARRARRSAPLWLLAAAACARPSAPLPDRDAFAGEIALALDGQRFAGRLSFDRSRGHCQFAWQRSDAVVVTLLRRDGAVLAFEGAGFRAADAVETQVLELVEQALAKGPCEASATGYRRALGTSTLQVTFGGQPGHGRRP